jgi:selenocysteine lyase/cysteine desulfurase
MLADHYGTFFAALGEALHVTAHSHHPWPDVTRAAHLQYWEDSARLTRDKWRTRIFSEVIPEAERHLRHHLGLPATTPIAFAPNAHEFVARLYSCFEPGRRARVLTTTSEFYSFERQTRRLEEAGAIEVVRVPVEPYAGFHERFRAALREPFDLVYLSQVLFDSAFVIDRLDALLADVPGDTLIAIDGYHAFLAIPVDLTALAPRIFYLGGGYKYVQAGEGACFMTLPADADRLRPVLTGWFSDGGLQSSRVPIGYGEGALRFWGSTFDASGLYRFNAVMRWLDGLGVTAHEIRAHVEALQRRFLEGLAALALPALLPDTLTPPAGLPRGNFLAFDVPQAAEVEARLAAADVRIDRRGTRLRFGFGVYHDAPFVDRLLARVEAALA